MTPRCPSAETWPRLSHETTAGTPSRRQLPGRCTDRVPIGLGHARAGAANSSRAVPPLTRTHSGSPPVSLHSLHGTLSALPPTPRNRAQPKQLLVPPVILLTNGLPLTSCRLARTPPHGGALHCPATPTACAHITLTSRPSHHAHLLPDPRRGRSFLPLVPNFTKRSRP